MKNLDDAALEAARSAALDVLLHNVSHSRTGLPRTARWGYPEPYTRDLMISALGFLVSGRDELVDALRRTLEALARNQSPRGLVPGLAHDPEDLGSSDTTPLFLIGLALYRSHTGERDFLDGAAQKALQWMEYQSPDDRVMVAQQPTSDWRDEQWVEGYGLYTNTL
jgi:glycogen debranching enzyme